ATGKSFPFMIVCPPGPEPPCHTGPVTADHPAHPAPAIAWLLSKTACNGLIGNAARPKVVVDSLSSPSSTGPVTTTLKIRNSGLTELTIFAFCKTSDDPVHRRPQGPVIAAGFMIGQPEIGLNLHT